MTTTQEAKPDAMPTQAEIQAFVMPKPARGSSVVWFPGGQRTKEFEVGFVTGVGRSAVQLRLASGYNKESVRHADDPRLLLNEHQRENGAWDFTDSDKIIVSLEKLVHELRDRLAVVEAKIFAPPRAGKGKPTEDSPF